SRPPSRTRMTSPSSSRNSVLRLRTCLGRPLGLPLWPRLNLVCFGGGLLPTRWPSSLLAMSLLPQLRVHALGRIINRVAGLGMKSIAAGLPLPAPDCDIDIKRIEIDPEADATSLLSSHERGARSNEGVEYRVPALGHVTDGVGDHEYGLHCRMRRKQLVAVSAERVQAPIGPQIGP